MNKVSIDESLHTIHNRIPGVSLDSKSSGGVHVWITGVPMEQVGGRFTMSVHLTKEQTVMLATELLYRVYLSAKNSVELIMNMSRCL